MCTSVINGWVIKTNGNIVVVDDKIYVNNILIDPSKGDQDLGNNIFVWVDRTINKSMNINGGQVNITDSGNIFCSSNGSSFTSVTKSGDSKGVNKKDYILNGTGIAFRKNIIVNGDIVLSGVNCTICRGVYDSSIPDLVVEGNLILSGVNIMIGNLLRVDGNVVTSGISCVVV